MSSTAETRILFVGDMHLGKQPTGVPDSLPVRELGPRQAWDRVVRTAVDLEVHCVALAGDLVHDDSDFFEAGGLLETGIRRLNDNGIPVCAVAGNHDTETLPDLAGQIEGLRLLGRGGTWSGLTVESGTGPAVRLVGWSFPDHHFSFSPLASARPDPDPVLVTLGLLHADLDAPGSRYAPVTSRELADCGLQGWFLGHVHRPDDVPADGSPFYLGSLTGLDPGEQGLHGPVLVTVSTGGNIAARRLPLAPLRWETLAIECTGLTDPAVNLPGHLLTAIRKFIAGLGGELDHVSALGLRLVLAGQVDDPAALQGTVGGIDLDDLLLPGADSTIFVQRITSRVTGTVALAELARHDHPAGILARLILALKNGAEPVPGVPDPAAVRTDLVRQARRDLAAVDARETFALLGSTTELDRMTDEEVADLLLNEARLALADLMAGREGDHAAL